MFISDMMKEDSYYFASDISEKMNDKFKEGFAKSDCSLNKKTEYNWLEDSEKIDVIDKVSKLDESIKKKIFHHRANNECLPYTKESFDCYLASLSLNQVNNHKNMLAESFRVLEKGGVAGFTVVGRLENCNYVTFLPEVVKSLGHDFSGTEDQHPSDLSDKDVLEKDIREAGFSSVKTYYTKANVIFRNDMELFQFNSVAPLVKQWIEPLDSEEIEELMVEYKKQYEEKFGKKTSEPVELEILVAVAVK